MPDPADPTTEPTPPPPVLTFRVDLPTPPFPTCTTHGISSWLTVDGPQGEVILRGSHTHLRAYLTLCLAQVEADEKEQSRLATEALRGHVPFVRPAEGTAA